MHLNKILIPIKMQEDTLKDAVLLQPAILTGHYLFVHNCSHNKSKNNAKFAFKI